MEVDILASRRKANVYMKTSKSLFGILTISFALAAHAQAPSFLTNGLVAYYPFNGNANDASGNGNNGTVFGATAGTNRFGKLTNSSFNFNGTSQYISLSTNVVH